MKKLLSILLALGIIFSFAACGSTDNDTSDNANPGEDALTSLTGTPLPDAMEKINEMGYTATYYADGVDFTDFIDSVKDDYTAGDITVNADDKTVEVTLELTSNIEADSTEKALTEKLEESAAWSAAEEYGKAEYGDSFELNYLVGKITASADDENTWFLKAECKTDGKDATCEARVTGTTDSPEITFFDVY